MTELSPTAIGHGEQVRYSLTATFTPSAPSASAAAAPSVATRLIGFRHIAMVTVSDLAAPNPPVPVHFRRGAQDALSAAPAAHPHFCLSLL